MAVRQLYTLLRTQVLLTTVWLIVKNWDPCLPTWDFWCTSLCCSSCSTLTFGCRVRQFCHIKHSQPVLMQETPSFVKQGKKRVEVEDWQGPSRKMCLLTAILITTRTHIRYDLRLFGECLLFFWRAKRRWPIANDFVYCLVPRKRCWSLERASGSTRTT